MLPDGAVKLIVAELIKKRCALEEELEGALKRPASYSIQGSYSETGRSVDDIRSELTAIDTEIRALATGSGDISYTYPRKVTL